MYFVEFARGDVNNLPRDLCGVLLPLIAFIDLKKKGRGLSLHVEIQFLIELRTQNTRSARRGKASAGPEPGPGPGVSKGDTSRDQ